MTHWSIFILAIDFDIFWGSLLKVIILTKTLLQHISSGTVVSNKTLKSQFDLATLLTFVDVDWNCKDTLNISHSFGSYSLCSSQGTENFDPYYINPTQASRIHVPKRFILILPHHFIIYQVFFSYFWWSKSELQISPSL
jgi:hypothetical protein